MGKGATDNVCTVQQLQPAHAHAYSFHTRTYTHTNIGAERIMSAP